MSNETLLAMCKSCSVVIVRLDDAIYKDLKHDGGGDGDSGGGEKKAEDEDEETEEEEETENEEETEEEIEKETKQEAEQVVVEVDEVVEVVVVAEEEEEKKKKEEVVKVEMEEKPDEDEAKGKEIAINGKVKEIENVRIIIKEVGSMKNPFAKSNLSMELTNGCDSQHLRTIKKEVGSMKNPFASFHHPTAPIDELTHLYFKAMSGVLLSIREEDNRDAVSNEPGEPIEDDLINEVMQQDSFSEEDFVENKFLLFLDSLGPLLVEDA